jgi:hypothetical protein
VTTVSALAILKASAALAGEVIRPDMGNEFAPDADTLARFTARLNERLPAIWGAANWPDVVEVDKRRRVSQALTTYATYEVLTDVWDADSNRSYRAMNPTGSLGSTLTDPSKWVQLQAEYQSSRFDVTKTHVAGEIVYYADPEILYYYINAHDVLPLLPFDPSFPYVQAREKYDMGSVLRVTRRDPRIHECPDDLPYDLNRDGVRVAGDPGSAWFTYRRVCPLIIGSPLDSTRGYAIGEQVFWVNGLLGDYYNVVLEAALPGETPATHAYKFAKVELPARFAQWLSAVVSADWLRWDRMLEKALDREAAALRELDRLFLDLGRDQRQTGQLAVRSPAYLP